MITRAYVLAVNGKCANVRIMKKTACESCDSCSEKGKCHADFILSDMQKTYDLTVDNTLEASSGDTVEVSSDGNKPLLLAFSVFVLPLVLAGLAYYFISLPLGQNTAVLSSLGVFVLSFVICAFASDRLSKKYVKSYISKIIEESGK